MSPRGKQIVSGLLLAGILGSGVAIGVVLDRLWLRPRATVESATARTERLIERFRGKLDLDDAQARVVADVLRRGREQAAAIRRRVEPELRAVRLRSRAEVTRVLRPEQRQRYEEMVRRWEAKRALRDR